MECFTMKVGWLTLISADILDSRLTQSGQPWTKPRFRKTISLIKFVRNFLPNLEADAAGSVSIGTSYSPNIDCHAEQSIKK